VKNLINFITLTFINLISIIILSFKSKSTTLMVDVDGTLLCNSLDERFSYYCSKIGFPTVEPWYRNCNITSLSLNYSLIIPLIILKLIGFNINIWTNRGSQNSPMTQSNLGIFWHLFSNRYFLEGQKGKDHNLHLITNNIMIENDPRYCSLTDYSHQVYYNKKKAS